MSQTISSANTSINSKRLPKVFNKINWDALTKAHLENYASCLDYYTEPIILDYGAGKYTQHIRQFCADKGWVYKAYDKYNGSDPDWCANVPNLIVCSNVLNVIKDDDEIYDIHEWIYNYNVPYLITVYEGNKTGSGATTKKDCYQRNDKTINYKRHDEIIYKNVITKPEYKKYIK